MRFNIADSEEIRDSMLRCYENEGFSIGFLPTSHIVSDLLCMFGNSARIERSYILQDGAQEFKPLDRSVTVVKVFVNIAVCHRRGDRFAYFRKILSKPRYHGLLVLNGIRSKDNSHAGDPLASRIFAVVSGKDGLSIEVVSHGGSDVMMMMMMMM